MTCKAPHQSPSVIAWPCIQRCQPHMNRQTLSLWPMQQQNSKQAGAVPAVTSSTCCEVTLHSTQNNGALYRDSQERRGTPKHRLCANGLRAWREKYDSPLSIFTDSIRSAVAHPSTLSPAFNWYCAPCAVNPCKTSIRPSVRLYPSQTRVTPQCYPRSTQMILLGPQPGFPSGALPGTCGAYNQDGVAKWCWPCEIESC